MRVFVFTCDRYLPLLKMFSYLFNVYWSERQPVVVGGYKVPGFSLPPNFTFVSIDEPCYPKERWSDGVIKFLNWASGDDYFVLMFEDYFLTRGVDHAAVASLEDYMKMHPDVLRIDLTTDRMMSGHAVDVGAWGHLDLIETPPDTPYQLSTQACVVNRRLFLEVLRPGLTPWRFETEGGLLRDGMRVLGTRQRPVRYTIGWGTGHEGLNLEGVPQEHLDAMKAKGWLNVSI